MKKGLFPLVLLFMLSACNDANIPGVTPVAEKPQTPPVTEQVVPPPPPVVVQETPTNPNIPDVGKVEQVLVTTKGVGMTPGAAVNDALKTAVMQVNGVAISTVSANLNVVAQAAVTVDVECDHGRDTVKAKAFLQGQKYADQIISRSGGLVTSFRIVNIVSPSEKDMNYVVDIEASIAKFKAPADAGKIKIVVAPLRYRQDTFNIGGRKVPAQEILEPLHRQIVDALAQTGRFTVLDRQFESQIEDELDMIRSGTTVNTNIAKLGQALSADLIWVAEVDSLAYNKHVRQLRTSNRDLVSYSGGWQVSQRLINLATRQIYQSNTLKGAAPSVGPTTLGTGANTDKILQDMQADIVKKASEEILLRSFPISIVELTGNQAILSQGGAVLKENNRYNVYLLGKELTDPQTKQSLGRVETHCCEAVITRVTPTVSYATLENIKTPLDGISVGDLQLREALKPGTVQSAPTTPEKQRSASAKPARRAVEKPTEEAPRKKKERDDW